ncbi:Palmitoyltransferase zdhhc20 [Podila verticillata]|nr:Palmitoyltransferase zdhhc20 [Podila verticillata]
MKLRKLRENCLWTLSWTPVGICTGIVGWSYYVFTTSVCRFLFDHDRVLQGVVYLFAVTIIVILQLWSYFLATFGSPGYPSETYPKGSDHPILANGHQDSEDDVNVALLERGQFYPSSPGPSTPPHNGRPGHATNYSTPSVHSGESIPAPPALQPVGSKPAQTMIRMTERSSHHQQQLGHDADDEDDDDVPLGRFRHAHNRFTVKSDGKMRYCQKCKFEKPDRTHHCSSCKRCVLKMDHHCPWLNNCVGHSNYKAFFLFVLWTAIYCVTLAACTIPVAAVAINLPYNENVFDPQWIFVILIAVVFGLCLVPFAIQHILLMKDNRTTIESFEKHKYRTGTQGQVMQSRVLNVFDLGKKQNFIQVLGPVWYLWLIPVRNSVGNGWSFPASEFGKQMLERDILESVAVHNGNSHGHDSHLDASRYHDSPSPAAWPAQGISSEQEDNDDGMDLTLSGTYDYRRDSDGSDSEGRGFFDPGTPRRFRKGFAPMYQGSEDEAEEELYDSDEPATIHFSRL